MQRETETTRVETVTMEHATKAQREWLTGTGHGVAKVAWVAGAGLPTGVAVRARGDSSRDQKNEKHERHRVFAAGRDSQLHDARPKNGVRATVAPALTD